MSKKDGPCSVDSCTTVGRRVLGYCVRHYHYFHDNGVPELPHHVPAALPVSDVIASWLAAVIDCEGWIGATRTKRAHGHVYMFAVGVGNTNRKLTDRLRSITGYGRLSVVVPNMPNAKDKHMWELSRYEEVRNFLATIRPHLILKQRQADIVLSLPPKNARAQRERQAAWEECRKLNKKGRH